MDQVQDPSLVVDKSQACYGLNGDNMASEGKGSKTKHVDLAAMMAISSAGHGSREQALADIIDLVYQGSNPQADAAASP